MPHPARPTVTLHDVAAAAGVSVATASRVLGNSSRTVAPEYEQRVLAAAAALRYTADASARAMRGMSDSITLVTDDLTTPSVALIVAEMERQARAVDACVTVSSTRGTRERQLETVRLLRGLRPRALVLTSSRLDANALDGRLLHELLAYEHEGGRVVVVGDTDMPFDSIGFDDRPPARELGAHLASTGHRRVLVLAGPSHRTAYSARCAGFLDGLHEGGVAAGDIELHSCEPTGQGGSDVISALGADGLAGVDAIIAASDVIAIGAMAALRAGGVSVPSDVSVTGFDDIPLAADVTPRLTTVSLPFAQVGAEAIALALRERAHPTRMTVQGEVVLRDSTRARH